MTDRSTDRFGSAPSPGDDMGELPDNLLRHYAGVLRRRYRWVLLGLLVGLLAGVLSTFLVKKHRVTTHYYKATNTQIAHKSATGTSAAGDSGYTLQQTTLLTQSQVLLDELAKRLKMTPDQVGKRLSASAQNSQQAIDVTGIATDPRVAERIADEGASLLRTQAETAARDEATATRKELQSKLDALTQQRQSLIDRIATKPPDADLLNQQLNAVVTQYGDVYTQLQSAPSAATSLTFTTLQPAAAIEINARGYQYRLDQNTNARNELSQSTNLTQPTFDETNLVGGAPVSKPLRIALGATAGLVLGLISAFLVEAWDDRIRNRERVEELTGLPVLAEVPRLARDEARNHLVAVADDASGAASERYRAARSSLLFALDALQAGGDVAEADRKAPIVMVTSPGPSEGKTTTTSNLSAAFADGGMRTLVIDGDTRRPSIRRYLLPVPNLVAPDEPSETRIEGVWFLPGPQGVTSPDEAVLKLRRSIARWRDDYDIVVLDTPPILTTNDAADLLAAADAVVLVLRSGLTRTGPARRVADLLNRYRADVLGVVLNSCDRRTMDQYYGYGSGYSSNRHAEGKNGVSDRSSRGERSRRRDAVGDRDAAVAALGKGMNGDGHGAGSEVVDRTLGGSGGDTGSRSGRGGNEPQVGPVTDS